MKRVTRMGLMASAAGYLLLAACSTPRDHSQQVTPDARLRVAQAAEDSGDHQAALSMYSLAANDPDADRQQQIKATDGMLRNGGMTGAKSFLERKIKENPDDPDLLAGLGAVQVMAGEADRAVATLSRSLSARPDDVRAMTNKAVALDVLHRHSEAQALYRKALARAPGDIAITNDLALSLMLSGQAELARQTVADLGRTENLPERVSNNIGIVEAAGGHSEEARARLGPRVAQGDLETLTRAISKEQDLGTPAAPARPMPEFRPPPTGRPAPPPARQIPVTAPPVRQAPVTEPKPAATQTAPDAGRDELLPTRLRPAGPAAPSASDTAPAARQPVHRPLQEQSGGASVAPPTRPATGKPAAAPNDAIMARPANTPSAGNVERPEPILLGKATPAAMPEAAVEATPPRDVGGSKPAPSVSGTLTATSSPPPAPTPPVSSPPVSSPRVSSPRVSAPPVAAPLSPAAAASAGGLRPAGPPPDAEAPDKASASKASAGPASPRRPLQEQASLTKTSSPASAPERTVKPNIPEPPVSGSVHRPLQEQAVGGKTRTQHADATQANSQAAAATAAKPTVPQDAGQPTNGTAQADASGGHRPLQEQAPAVR